MWDDMDIGYIKVVEKHTILSFTSHLYYIEESSYGVSLYAFHIVYYSSTIIVLSYDPYLHDLRYTAFKP